MGGNNEVLLHELIHELMGENDLTLKSWQWNEGLITYRTHFALGTHRRFLQKPQPTRDRMWSIYADYAHRWAMLFKAGKPAYLPTAQTVPWQGGNLSLG